MALLAVLEFEQLWTKRGEAWSLCAGQPSPATGEGSRGTDMRGLLRCRVLDELQINCRDLTSQRIRELNQGAQNVQEDWRRAKVQWPLPWIHGLMADR